MTTVCQARRNAGTARFFLEIDDGFLLVLDLLGEAVQFVQRFLPLRGDSLLLNTVTLVGVLVRKRVDTRLQSDEIGLVPGNLRLEILPSTRPVRLILDDIAAGRRPCWRGSSA